MKPDLKPRPRVSISKLALRRGTCSGSWKPTGTKMLLTDTSWFHGAGRLERSDMSGPGRGGCEGKGAVPRKGKQPQ